MGQKVNPHGMRVGVIKDWDSRWYAREEKVGDLLVEDKKIRDYLKKTLYGAGIPKIEIERRNDMVTMDLIGNEQVVLALGGTHSLEHATTIFLNSKGVIANMRAQIE